NPALPTQGQYHSRRSTQPRAGNRRQLPRAGAGTLAPDFPPAARQHRRHRRTSHRPRSARLRAERPENQPADAPRHHAPTDCSLVTCPGGAGGHRVANLYLAGPEVRGVIRLSEVTYHYPRAAAPALNGLSLEIPAGQFCAIIGANGAGKTTLCATLTGFVPHFYRGNLTGMVEVAGIDIAGSTLADLAGTVGLVFSNPFNQITGARFTVRDEVAFGLENMGVPLDEMGDRIDAMLKFAG